MKKIVKMLSILILIAGFLAACVDDGNAKSFFAENENDWPELGVIEDEIGSDFESINVENDEGNSRVILYENDGKPEYKSIYILDEQRLKIISIGKHGEGQVYNEVIS